MPKYFDFEVSLLSAELRMWRRFLLRQTATFRDLHSAIQDACGWEECHLYEFRESKGRQALARAPYQDPFDDSNTPTDTKVKLALHFTRKGSKCIYLYDFGDSWEHLVELKAVVDLPGKLKRKLVGGARAFPPEDCGGIWGYERCLAAVGAIKADDFDEIELEEAREWLGDWEPEAFDLEATQKDFDR